MCRVLFTVSDTGPGIPDEILDTIFETFTQAPNISSPYARQYERAGLGLPLAKRLANLIGGTLALASEENKGTTAYISLPFAKSGSGGDQEAEHLLEYLACYPRMFKILVADDDHITRIHIQRILEKEGFAVHVVPNGEQVIAQLACSEYDCILMDIQMPALDGLKTTRHIRVSASDYKNIPVIVMSAFAMIGDREFFLAAGMDDYISKPVDREELLQVLQRNIFGQPEKYEA